MDCPKAFHVAFVLVSACLVTGCPPREKKPEVTIGQAWNEQRQAEITAAANPPPLPPAEAGPTDGSSAVASNSAVDRPEDRPALTDKAAPKEAAGATAPPAASAVPTGGPAAIAFVNGKPIEREAVVGVLLEAYGLNVLQQEIALAAVRQAAITAGVRIRDSDIEREYDNTLRRGDDEPISPIRRAELIEVWRKRTGVSAAELRIAMTRQAYLRRMAEPSITVTDKLIADEYERQYGEKVEVRHMQLASIRDAEQVRRRLAAGESFEALAARFSQNRMTAGEGGLLPPFTAGDLRFPKTLREAAFQLQPGQTSDPIQFEGQYHVLLLVRRLPRGTVPLAQVRAKLESDVRQRLTADEMDRLALDIVRKAKIRIDDPSLRTAYQREQNAGRATGPPLQ